mmetsp:Transcript_73716/g.191467  ORF Transcript_73716/g.191467 Transcript_73716/m.191467 type:complete len:94 (-) Transcript_73716:96-377(-)
MAAGWLMTAVYGTSALLICAQAVAWLRRLALSGPVRRSSEALAGLRQSAPWWRRLRRGRRASGEEGQEEDTESLVNSLVRSRMQAEVVKSMRR